MTPLRRLMERHPLPAFFVAACAFSWWSAPFARGSLLPHGPFIAALVVLGIEEDREGLRALSGRLKKWRVGWWWYAVAPGLVLAYLLAALAVLLLLGVRLAGTPGTWSLDLLPSRLLPLLLMGGMWEEPGWSGFALPKLQERYAGRRLGALKASLVLGALRAGWHVPLAVGGAIPWYDVVFFVPAFQLLVSWLYNRTGGSLPVVMLFHLASNILGGALLVPLFAGVDFTRYYLLFTGFAWLLAILLVRSGGWSIGTRSARKD